MNIFKINVSLNTCTNVIKFLFTIVISKFDNEFTTFIYVNKKVIDINLKTCTTVIVTCTTINMIINFTNVPATLN